MSVKKIKDFWGLEMRWDESAGARETPVAGEQSVGELLLLSNIKY